MDGDNKPHPRMSAYAFFLQTCHEEHKKEHPNELVVFGEFADRWKAMSEKEKTRFNQMAENDKMRYESEMANYETTDKYGNTGKDAKGGKRKFVKDPNAPKRSVPAFFWFSKDEYPKVKETVPDSTVLDIAAEVGKRWNESPSDVRAKYEALAAEDKSRYMKELKAYKERNQKLKGTSSNSKKGSDDEYGEKEEEEKEQEKAEPEEEEKEEKKKEDDV